MDELSLCQQVRAMCACNQLRRASRGMTQVYDSVVARERADGDAAADPRRSSAWRDRCRVTALAGALGIDRTTLTRNLKVLQQRGLVESIEHGEDARVRLTSLTPDGPRVLSQALARWARVQVGGAGALRRAAAARAVRRARRAGGDRRRLTQDRRGPREQGGAKLPGHTGVDTRKREKNSMTSTAVTLIVVIADSRS